jgi:uncharacterized protein YbcC (UPF0753/DUF2309 family)
MTNQPFDDANVLHELKHYLPSQTPLKDFIHHNSLHAFQQMKFYDAIFKASKIFGFQATMELQDFRKLFEIGRIREEVLDAAIVEAKGVADFIAWKEKIIAKQYDEHNAQRIGRLRANWKTIYQLDLDNLVQPLLFRVLCSYLDQGIAVWEFPNDNGGFLAAIRNLEKNNYTSFFQTSRAKRLLQQADLSIGGLLKILVGKEAYFEQYLFDQQFTHRGWGGLVSAVEDSPDTLLSPKKISLHDLVIFELLLEIDNLDRTLGTGWQPLCNQVEAPPVNLFASIVYHELQDVFRIWQNAFEWSYYDEVLAGIKQSSITKHGNGHNGIKAKKTFQALFCIDERECSLRRHIEGIDAHCETFGTPGFFSVEFYFQANDAKFYDKLCPAPVTPAFLVKEYDVAEKRKHDLFYTNKTHSVLTGFISTLTLGFWAAVRLVQNLFRPKMAPAISNAFAHMNGKGKLTVENKDPAERENGLQVGFTVSEMATRVASLLNGIGLTADFASIVYVMAHGSSSANNPHHGAHDCGACSGRPGSVNARVFASMANNEKVRSLLREKNIDIPTAVQFVGGLHDTAADEIEFYDTLDLSESNVALHRVYVQSFEQALDLNAKERSRRFASINTKASLRQVRQAIKERSVSLFEPRPELGHGTNTLCIVGRRNLTKGIFLDRRAFLNSYDYRTDPAGVFLTGIMKPLGPVCGGINLEYYFSRVDNYKLGAGTKLPHNVMGLFGVANSSDGDLRPGLPWQMIEVHDPVRLLIVVEHFPEIVLRTVQSTPEMYEWFINEWVHLVAVNPETNELFYFKEGAFVPYHPLTNQIHFFKDVHHLLEDAKGMESNHIAHATQENLPIYFYN